MIALTARRGRVALRLTAERLGDDLAVTVSGGDRAHIGAVAVSPPRPARGGAPASGATTSVVALLGHREDELARKIAARLAAVTRGAVCVACGVHVDGIVAGEIRDVLELGDELTERLLARLATGGRGRAAQRASSSHHRRSQAPKRRKPRRSTA